MRSWNSSRLMMPADRALKAVKQARPRLAVHNIPHLGFAILAFHPEGIFVVRMHLHGKVILGIDELNQHRELLEGGAVGPQEGLSLLPQKLRQGFARVFAVCNDGAAVLMAGELPAFGYLFQIGLFAEVGFQPGAAPDVILQGGC